MLLSMVMALNPDGELLERQWLLHIELISSRLS
jgi:hypothetical protein